MYLGEILNAVTLSVRADGTYVPFSSDAWGYSGQMTLLGMLMVFTVLAILWGVLSIFKLIFAPRKKKAQSAEEVKEVSANNEEQSEETFMASNDAELVAILTAAVAAYMSEESGAEVPTDGFRVVSFRKTSGVRSWNKK